MGIEQWMIGFMEQFLKKMRGIIPTLIIYLTVLTIYKKNISKEKILEYDLPHADGYKGFWENSLSIQHPLASIELVEWDSSEALIFSDNKEIIDSFRKAFPLSEDLALYNQR